MPDLEDLPIYEKFRRHKPRNRIVNHHIKHRSCTEKIRYHSQEQAKTSRASVKRSCAQQSKTYSKLRIYACHNCGGFHLTSCP